MGKTSAIIRLLAVTGGPGFSSGHFYANCLIKAMGIAGPSDGMVLISIAHYNLTDELNRLIKFLDDII
tara:strand:- start:3098 stop:3301 length:204 start_codon:yes stop_codon:yes gene_type:complete